MKQVADGVWQLSGFPPNAINVYFADGVIFDAATRYEARRILKQVSGREVRAHALTHAHPDHQGATRAICERLGVPLLAGAADADAAENPELIGRRQPDHWLAQFFFKTMTGPGHPVARKLREGDQVGSFKVIDAPGHSAGHVVFWREEDRVLIVGDVVLTADPLTLLPGLREPKPYLTPDPAENRRSIRKLGPLQPKLVLSGHGPPLRDTRKWDEFVEQLPD
jgi:hydroxyacylglutathione hydrolase